MTGLILSLLVAQSGFSLEHFAHGMVTRMVGGLADRVITVRITSDDDQGSAEDTSEAETDDADEADEGADTEVLPPVPPVPALPGQRVRKYPVQVDRGGRDLPHFTEKAKNVPTAEVLHRIARTAGWSMTLVGAPKELIDVDVKDADPREALRQVLKQSGAMGVLKSDKLVVVATPDSQGAAGMLIEKNTSSRRGGVRVVQGSSRRGHHEIVRVFQGDITVNEGQNVQGDVVCVGGSIELKPGSVVQGDAVAVGGSVHVNQGALVMGQAVAVLGSVDVERGGQVMGEPVSVGIGKMWGSRSKHRGWLTRLGPFGLFPTVALFAVIYLTGLLVLRMWPERVRNVGYALFENPVRSFTVGFLCWLLLLPLVVLLAISLVGIPLIPLLPVMIFLSIVVGLSSIALRIGEALPAGPGQRFVPPAALGMGMTVLLLVAFVPWLGVSILALIQFFALGASVSSRFGRALPAHTPNP
ncbi:MAG TPA: hypothetical protein VEP66_11560 [Myxococcales bacterium]|nr:hypothetical protein [Myxococcales bacterium]